MVLIANYTIKEGYSEIPLKVQFEKVYSSSL